MHRLDHSNDLLTPFAGLIDQLSQEGTRRISFLTSAVRKVLKHFSQIKSAMVILIFRKGI